MFGVHGFFNFTKQGFESSASSRFNASDLQGVSMKGKVVVVTGKRYLLIRGMDPNFPPSFISSWTAYFLTLLPLPCLQGANSGLGKAVTLDLAQRGATVNMVCRNAATAAQVQKEIIQETSNSNIHLRIANVASPVQLDGIVGELSAEFGKVDVLVNNAGGIYEKREQTENGVDASFATNTFATYYLTEKCMPLLLKSEDARVVSKR